MASRNAQKIVWLNGMESFLLEGDRDRDEPRFSRVTREAARFGQAPPSRQFGQALPLLLSEGWQIESVAAIGNGQSHVLLSRAPGESGDGAP